MKNQRLLAALMAVSMTLCSGAAFAEGAAETLTTQPVAEMAMPSSVMVDGIVSQVQTEEEVPYILLGEDRADQLHLHISQETVLIKADGTPISLADIKAGDTLRVYHSAMTTRSLPPQTTALAVILMEDDAVIPPLYLVAGDITKTEEGLEISSDDGSYLVRPTKDTEVVPYKTRNIVTAADIKKGNAFLAWAEVVTLSLPGIAVPEKIMVLPAAAEVGETEEALQGLYVNGEALAVDMITDGETTLVPLRAVSEKLGYTVTWNGAERSVVVGDLKVVLNDVNVTTQTARSTNQLEKAPVLVNELTYVPVSFFELLTGNAPVTGDGLVQIQA